MENKVKIGLDEALALTLSSIPVLEREEVGLLDAAGRVAAENIRALVDSPSIDASLKDGYGLVSHDVCEASDDNPVTLRLVGQVAAGDGSSVEIGPGSAVRILTGGKIPDGCDAVVAEEFTGTAEGLVTVKRDAEPGRNILPRGCDVKCGDVIVDAGRRIGPGTLGLIAAGGHDRVKVVRRPHVAIVATGDEVVAPGKPLPEGKLYASNIVTLSAWCRRYGFVPHLEFVPDDPVKLAEAFGQSLETQDAVITSGGAWTGDRDLVAKILDELGWKKLFHRLRIGPGKAAGCGLVGEKPVFILPGGPPSNLTGFLQIALPGLLKLSGSNETGLPLIPVQLERPLDGRFVDWTQFVFGTLAREAGADLPLFTPIERGSRLRSMAEAQALVKIPEGETMLPEGAIVNAQQLDVV